MKNMVIKTTSTYAPETASPKQPEFAACIVVSTRTNTFEWDKGRVEAAGLTAADYAALNASGAFVRKGKKYRWRVSTATAVKKAIMDGVSAGMLSIRFRGKSGFSVSSLKPYYAALRKTTPPPPKR